ncbi:MAG: radical SAM protein [Patescibacteria group bacterium]|nr:radical SAM protein [Patescibacteria group bacterium]
MKNFSKNLSSIRDVVLAVTYQCNGRCKFCNIWQNPKSFSCQSSDYENLPHNLKSVNISGGEPFLRDDLPEIVRTISRQCPKAKIIISTNGFLPSVIKKTMTKIIKFKRDIGVAVSLDGFGLIHEEMRGFPGGFCLVIETIRLLKELGVKDLKIAFTLNNQNINQLKRVYYLSKELEVEFSLAACHNSSHYFQKEDNKIRKIESVKKEINWLIEQELKRFSLKRWARAYFAQGLIEFLGKGRRILPDYSGLTSIFIDPFGNIYPSDVWDLKIGHLKKVRDWNKFVVEAQKTISCSKKPISWMICTVRQAIKNHKFQVGWWVLRRRVFGKRGIKKASSCELKSGFSSVIFRKTTTRKI